MLARKAGNVTFIRRIAAAQAHARRQLAKQHQTAAAQQVCCPQTLPLPAKEESQHFPASDMPAYVKCLLRLALLPLLQHFLKQMGIA